MKICLEFDSEKIKLLNKICLDGNFQKFLLNFLDKELFTAFSKTSPISTHIQYYDEVNRIMKMLNLKQEEIANHLGFSRTAVTKSFKTYNERSVIYRAMTQYGSPDNFVFDVYLDLLSHPDTALANSMITGDILEYLRKYFEFSQEKFDKIFKFIMFLNIFALRTKPKTYDLDKFVEAVKKLDRKLWNDFDETILDEKSAERLYTALYEYYLSLGL